MVRVERREERVETVWVRVVRRRVLVVGAKESALLFLLLLFNVSEKNVSLAQRDGKQTCEN